MNKNRKIIGFEANKEKMMTGETISRKIAGPENFIAMNIFYFLLAR